MKFSLQHHFATTCNRLCVDDGLTLPEIEFFFALSLSPRFNLFHVMRSSLHSFLTASSDVSIAPRGSGMNCVINRPKIGGIGHQPHLELNAQLLKAAEATRSHSVRIFEAHEELKK